MSKFRQPVPAAQAFVLVFSAVAFGIAQHWAGNISSIEFLLAMVLVGFVFQPVSTLIHELGHGVVACRLGGGPAAIMVGRGPWMQFCLGQMRVNFSLLPGRGVMVGGVCRYQAERLSWRSRTFVTLAGPAATLIELVLGFALAAVIWPHEGAFVRNLIVLSLVGLMASLVINLSPMKVSRGGKAVVVGTDGTRARVAWRLHRAGAPAAAEAPPPKIPDPPRTWRIAPTPAAEAARGVQSGDTARAATSVPPPTPTP